MKKSSLRKLVAYGALLLSVAVMANADPEPCCPGPCCPDPLAISNPVSTILTKQTSIPLVKLAKYVQTK